MPWGLAATSARLAAALNLQVMNFRTDTEILARAAESRSWRHYPGNWSLQPILAEFRNH
jgi:hypothetical protein